MQPKLKLSRATLPTLGRVVAPFFYSEKKRVAWGFLATLLGLLVIVNAIAAAQSLDGKGGWEILPETPKSRK